MRKSLLFLLEFALINFRSSAADADNLLTQVQALHARVLGILAKAESANDLRAATGAIRETRGCLELLGKLGA